MQKANHLIKRSRSNRHITGLLTAVVFLSMAISLGACRKEEKAVVAMVPVVETVTVTQKDVPVKKEWIGVLDGMVNATIRAQVSGYLTRQNYREGQPVKKGQVLFEIDPRSFQASLNKAKAQVSQQKARHEQAKANLGRIIWMTPSAWSFPPVPPWRPPRQPWKRRNSTWSLPKSPLP